ncbi:uncharacterized protein [Ptychodera flava]|uniref:uncharacterized protein n=1 Tax=Ptychodera flava TaxID=63121 RepID=UPI00396A5A95
MRHHGVVCFKSFAVLVLALWLNIHIGVESQEIECEPLTPPPEGFVNVTIENDIHVAYLTCPEGYKVSGAVKRRCINGVWTGLETECYDGIDPDLEMSLIIGASCAGGVIVLCLFFYLIYIYCFKSNDDKDVESGSHINASKEAKYENKAAIIEDE